MNNPAIMPDESYEELEPAVRLLVRTINEFGIFVSECCEGHLEQEKTPYPYVWLGINPSTTAGIDALSKNIGEWNSIKEHQVWGFVPDTWEQYRPHGYSLKLKPQEENTKRKKDLLHKLQREAVQLAQFLQEELPLSP